jgi:hypothetical protein
MSQSTFRIINIVVVVLLVISMFFPYQRFNIAIEHSTIIKIIIGAVAIAVGVRLLIHRP